VKTDSLFHRIFRQAPSIFFELIGQAAVEGYQFRSIEVKQTAFRLDGVFLPPANAPDPVVYFVEVQFQKDDTLYQRLFAEVFVYLDQHPDTVDWQAVVIYGRRSFEPEVTHLYRTLLDSPQVHRIYLEERKASASSSVGLGLLQLIVEPEKSAATKAKDLLAQVQRETSIIPTNVIIELIETAMVYKFPQMSRQEIAQMLGLVELQQTRVYQEGQEQGERNLILKLLTRRLGKLPAEIIKQIEALSLEKLEALGEALLDFSALNDLTAWLQHSQES
jgi:predicted transposase/invertase (TIGR01784 family)